MSSEGVKDAAEAVEELNISEPSNDVFAAASSALGLSEDQIPDMMDGEDDDMTPLPAVIIARIEALRMNQDKRNQIEEKYREERRALDMKYRQLYSPLYSERADIVTGRVKAEGEDKAEEADEQNGVTEGKDMVGVPQFWLNAFSAHPMIEDMITDNDREALDYLVDLKCEDNEDLKGFRLKFQFKPNPFFDNSELVKSYDIPNMVDGGEPVLENVKGTEIRWKDGKNLCERTVTKKLRQKGKKGGPTKTVTKQEPCESFFQFFVPPDLPTEGTELTEEMEEVLMQQIDADFEMGMIFKDKMVPHAVLWYTGEAIEDEEDSDYDPEEEDSEEDSEDEDEDSEGDDDDEEEDDEEGAAAGKKRSGKSKGKGGGDEKPDDCKNQ